MFKFESSQRVYRIGDIEIGGHPGQRPTVMVGSIFFQKHRIVSDPRKGTFDEDKARALLEWSRLGLDYEYGNHSDKLDIGLFSLPEGVLGLIITALII